MNNYNIIDTSFTSDKELQILTHQIFQLKSLIDASLDIFKSCYKKTGTIVA